jgi:hypothetical protein
MQHHRSIGTTSLVALMAAHRMVHERSLSMPFDAGTIHRIAERLWDSNGLAPHEADTAFASHASRGPAPSGAPAAG